MVNIYGAPATEALEVPMVLGPAMPSSQENLLEMQNSRPAEWETRKGGVLVFSAPQVVLVDILLYFNYASGRPTL